MSSIRMNSKDRIRVGFLATIILANIITQAILMGKKQNKVKSYNSKQQNKEDEPKSLTYMNYANIANIAVLGCQGFIFCYLFYLVFKGRRDPRNEYKLIIFSISCLIMGCVQIWFMIDYHTIQNRFNSYMSSLTGEEDCGSSFYPAYEIAAISFLTIYFLIFVYILGKANCNTGKPTKRTANPGGTSNQSDA